MSSEGGAGGSEEWGKLTDPSSTEPVKPGDLVLEPGVARVPQPLVGSDESTPLEEDEPEGTVPPSPLWAMKDRRHTQWHLLPSHERHERVRDCVGSGDEAVYVIDDGRHHAMFGHRVGAHGDEVEYCLIGRVPRQRYEDLKAGRVAPRAAFDGAEELTLCGVAVAESILSSNIFDVEHYSAAGDIPAAYLPGAPYLALDEDLDITAD